MRTLLVGNEYKDRWNALARSEPFFALMQSWEWGDFKARTGWKVFRIAVEDNGTLVAGAQVLIKALPLHLAGMAYVPRGPIGAWFEDGIFTPLFACVSQIAHRYNAIFLKIEPPCPPDPCIEAALSRHAFVKTGYHSQPIATIIMDIAQPHQAILHGMRKSTRRKITAAGRKGVTVRPGEGEDVGAFYRLMKITAERGGFVAKSFRYYLNEWETFRRCDRAGFFLAYYQDTLIAANMIYAFGKHAAFFHQVSSGAYANLNPNCLLAWEAVRWAKSRGCCTFDLWGIPDEVDAASPEDEDAADLERTDGLWGVYKFKRGFSKNIVTFMGSFDLVYRPFLYATTLKGAIDDKTLERALVWLDHFR